MCIIVVEWYHPSLDYRAQSPEPSVTDQNSALEYIVIPECVMNSADGERSMHSKDWLAGSCSALIDQILGRKSEAQRCQIISEYLADMWR